MVVVNGCLASVLPYEEWFGEEIDTKFEAMPAKCHDNWGAAEVVVTFGILWCLSHDLKLCINFYCIMVLQN